jgi:hypothetical protein
MVASVSVSTKILVAEVPNGRRVVSLRLARRQIVSRIASGVAYLLPAASCQSHQRCAYEDPGKKKDLEILDSVRTSKDPPSSGSHGGLPLLVHQVIRQMRLEHRFLQSTQPPPS